MDKKYFEHIANIKELGKYHYKILLLLMVEDYSQSDISKLLDIKKQNVNRVFKDLEKLELIEIKEKIVSNKYYRLVDIKALNVNVVGQIKFI
ncbi:winged helix-turn-helix domain-containing protein [Clostridium perfringens]|uniref:winged helix-turn-helix domain-containing protein n=1 Tax=Clostridium perfringens TaxID=1502 RepID=UPI0024BCC484|nr:winged helix-turn-helix domain-containing protein [Clostridium perfringens]MDK0737899.1 winged helix-turn-helix domain-containing protein [Clostridium perfringens]